MNVVNIYLIGDIFRKEFQNFYSYNDVMIFYF